MSRFTSHDSRRRVCGHRRAETWHVGTAAGRPQGAVSGRNCRAAAALQCRRLHRNGASSHDSHDCVACNMWTAAERVTADVTNHDRRHQPPPPLSAAAAVVNRRRRHQPLPPMSLAAAVINHRRRGQAAAVLIGRSRYHCQGFLVLCSQRLHYRYSHLTHYTHLCYIAGVWSLTGDAFVGVLQLPATQHADLLHCGPNS